ncbi:MAG: YitT family protein [Acidimicrobiaceae bacterium]|nr:YitT family protein [Acidimicrobiaceae bacterium]
MKLSHKIPHTPWRATTTWSIRPRMALPLLVGLSIFGVGEGLLVQSRWGATPWTVFAEGVARHAHLSIGWATALISCVVLLAWFPLRERPGFGTLANLVIIAYVLDLTTLVVAVPVSVVMKVAYIVLAVVAIGIGSALYLTTGLGPGPRDGLMTSLHRHLHVSVVYVRLALELSVLVAGWLLGGTVGVGTAVFATTIGFSIGASLQITDRLVRRFSQ